jgi:CheY-like chemotaxis protein
MANKKPTVLIVEDTPSLRKLLAAELGQDKRFSVDEAGTGEEALKKAASPDCKVIVLDMMLPDMDGLQFIERLRQMRPDGPSVIAMTGASEVAVPDSIIEAPYRGLVSAVFRKPFDHAKLRETIAFCLAP